MAHPIMFDADDPLLARLRGICMEFPDAAEKISHGRVVWFTTKVFAVYGGKVKGDHADPLLDRALLVWRWTRTRGSTCPPITARPGGWPCRWTQATWTGMRWPSWSSPRTARRRASAGWRGWTNPAEGPGRRPTCRPTLQAGAGRSAGEPH
ncbi:hypothetical protein ACWIE7_19215 [Dietzia sp. NPDC055343]